ncbi:flagellar basal body-associated FliL family protein [Rhodobacter calidifons]|uniref:Flagellar protein FliL n=1 Tax=Rhodobacter calidifons TaxID=2715277 RepID=A0ABX0G6S4_9RHOB|nr:flagellar basal body-associated FliL family protein [Rhodobacter calidifons]NHB76672.1 flagellar basal body-associated FliL family protein [Rhodobacter calidifons]
MIGKILPVLLALIGLGGGVGAGLLLRPSSEDAEHAATGEGADHVSDEQADDHSANSEGQVEGAAEYVKMNNQFVVPVVKNGRVASMVVLSLSLEVAPGNTEAVYQREPKLRDAFLQVLFDHANVGGFSGSFTDGSNLVVLRNTLKEAAVLVLGGVVTNILITDIARQDV